MRLSKQMSPTIFAVLLLCCCCAAAVADMLLLCCCVLLLVPCAFAFAFRRTMIEDSVRLWDDRSKLRVRLSLRIGGEGHWDEASGRRNRHRSAGVDIEQIKLLLLKRLLGCTRRFRSRDKGGTVHAV